MSVANNPKYGEINNHGAHILNLYHTGDFPKLSQQNLATDVDSKGNTIIHIIATNLDKNALEELIKHNGRCLIDVINKPNNKKSCPLHKALKAIEKIGAQDYSIITYMINELNADPSKPDGKDRIIDIVPGSMTETESESGPLF